MATLKQKRAFDGIVDNGRNKGKVMIKAGYSKNTAKAPTKLTKSKGWQELLDEHLPDSLITNALEEDIKKKPQNRKPELELASKLKGKLTDKVDITSTGKQIDGIVMMKPNDTINEDNSQED